MSVEREFEEAKFRSDLNELLKKYDAGLYIFDDQIFASSDTGCTFDIVLGGWVDAE